MILRDIFKKQINEGGNLSLPGGHEAQHIDLKVHNRGYIVPILDNLINSINNTYQQHYQTPLWDPKLLKQRTFLSGSSLHFFNTDIPDEEFTAKKPKVGDIDTQVNKEYEGNLEQFLTANQGKVFGPAKLLGFQRGNEQFSSLWEFTDPPIKVQIDLEFVKYDKKGPTAWSQFSHSSSWEDLQAGVKGVFHKFLIQSFTSLTNQDFLLRKMVGRGKARVEQDVPTTDNMVSFAVSSSEGGGLRAKYAPVMDERGKPLIISGLPVMQALPPAGYEQDLGQIFATIFGSRVNSAQLKKVLPKTWSFTGLLEVMNMLLDTEEKQKVVDGFVDKLFAPGAQGLYKNDPERDITEKNTALNLMFATLKVSPPANLEQMRQDYKAGYKMTVKESLQEAEVKAQLRKGMPHLRDLKPADFLDLVDELRADGGRFKLQNIPLNVKVDGFGGRFGKNAEGKPFMGTSNTPPRYEAGFVKYNQDKGRTDPEILARAANFDKLFDEMMNAIKIADAKLGPDFLVDKQVTCEVLFLPFATQTSEGKLKFVGIEYDQLPKGVDLVLVPFRVVEASTGEEVPDGDNIIQALTELGQSGSVMFMSNRLVQKDGLDVTEIINPLENLEELKQIVSDTMGKRDRASLELRREVEAQLKPVQIALEKAIDEDPNIVGKDKLGQDYEGIVINSRLGPIKVTSQKQKDIIVKKNAAKVAARTEQPRESSNKTAVVAIGSFVGHRGHEELFNYTINKAKEVGGDPYLFIGNAVGKDDPIPPDVKVQTWHKMYPQYAKNISTTQQGGSLMQKIKHELINPLPGKSPRYDNIIIMVGEDQASMPIAGALMKAVNKFRGYEHVKVSLEVTPRGTGMSFSKLRNILKDPNATEQQQLALWSQGFDSQKLGVDWIKHLMDITKKGMGIAQQPATQPAPAPQPVAERLSTALIRPRTNEATFKKSPYGRTAASQQRAKELLNPPKPQEPKKDEKPTEEGYGNHPSQRVDPRTGKKYVPPKSPLNKGTAEATGDKPFDNMMKNISKGTNKQKTADRKEQQKQTQQRAHDAFGNMFGSGNPADKLKIREQGVAEGSLEELANTSLKVKEPKDFVNTNDRKQVTYKVMKFKSGKDTYLINFTVKGPPAFGKKQNWNAVNVAFGVREEQDDYSFGDEINTDLTARNKNQFLIYSTVINAVRKFITEYNTEIDEIIMQGAGERQEAMYQRFFQSAGKYFPGWHHNGKHSLVRDVPRPTGKKVREQGVVEAGSPAQQAAIAIAKKKEKGVEEEKQRLDPSCWKGYKKQGTKMKGGTRVNNCVPVSEDVQNIMDALINKIIFNEAVSNKRK